MNLQRRFPIGQFPVQSVSDELLFDAWERMTFGGAKVWQTNS